MIILTPNRRLTAFSLQQFNAQQLAVDHACWLTPEIYPLEVWLMQIWQLCLDNNLASYRPLLTPKQQQLLFERIIQKNSATELLRVSATAENAIQAWRFLKQWRIDLKKLAAYAAYTPDTAAFYVWMQAYLLWLDENQYYDLQLMVDRLIDLVPQIVAFLPQQICLRGFNELIPQYAALFDALAAHGVQIARDHLTSEGAQVIKSGFENFKYEIFGAAAWAYELLEADDQQTVGIVVPNLEQERSFIHEHFLPGFAPGWVNISAPLPLASYTLISSSLQILGLATTIINYNDFSKLLRCPFIANFASACNARAVLDRRLRDAVEARIAWPKLLQLIAGECPDISNSIEQFVLQIDKLHGKHSATHWAQQMQRLLQCWQWAGDVLIPKPIPEDDLGYTAAAVGELNKQEQDLLSCWLMLLEEYSRLDTVLEKHTYAQALQLVQRLANETPFLPSETGITKIHILGLLEAEGLVFDHLWVCGMRSDTWPPMANPNPFIPIELQRQYALPHSSAQRELEMAQKYTANLQLGARHSVVFSYPKLVDDYNVLPSNLLAHIPEEKLNFKHAAVPFVAMPLETWSDTQAPTFTETYVPGGATSLRLQAQCPFKANAELRLYANPLNDPQTILTPMLRGSLVHEVLENFWRQCKSHAQLVSYTADELETMLSKIIHTALEAWQRDLPQTLTSNYVALEAHRLYKLIARWLAYEAKRNAFVVYQLEEKTLVTVGPLQINMKIDRIDQVDGNYVIIDYKTGETNMAHWFTQPDQPLYEPQLPIYAVSVKHDVAAVTFATLRGPELKFVGVAAEENLLPNVKPMDDWHTMQKEWRRKLAATADEFVAGYAAVDPFSTEVCNRCKLQSFCRIYEQLQ